MFRRMLLLLLTVIPASTLFAADAPLLDVILRSRGELPPASGNFAVSEKSVKWNPKQTAIIICDMWDDHWCQGAAKRVVELAPKMNRVVTQAREQGMLIIHSPSGCVAFYKDHPARKLAQKTPVAADVPKDINNWCRHIPEEDRGRYPIDQTDGGCDCSPRCPHGNPWKRQVDLLEIRDTDAISDSGYEIWSLLADRKIDNVILMGVHTNMCVLGRPFGLRNLARYGKNVVLARDLTDTMYNSRRWPYVSHFEGTDRIVEHIEKYVCPTILSTSITGSSPFVFNMTETRPRIVFVVGEDEYETKTTLPKFASEELEPRGYRCTFVMANEPDNKHDFPEMAAVDKADLLFVSVRRRAPKSDEMDVIKRYLASAKPVLGIRTASHAFDAKGKFPAGHAELTDLDAAILGGSYQGHHGNTLEVTVSLAPGAEKNPLLEGVAVPFPSGGSLYKNTPLKDYTTPLLLGSIAGAPSEPVAWTRLSPTEQGTRRVFYTSLGHKADFEQPAFRRLLVNGVQWALERESR